MKFSCLLLAFGLAFVGCSDDSSTEEPSRVIPPKEVNPPHDDGDLKAILLNPRDKTIRMSESMPFYSSFFLNAEPYHMKVRNADPQKSPIESIALDGEHNTNYKVETCLSTGKSTTVDSEKDCEISVYTNLKSVWKKKENEVVYIIEDADSLNVNKNE